MTDLIHIYLPGKASEAKARKLKHQTTRPCPRCGVRIEKNGGCPHMTCVQPTCKYEVRTEEIGGWMEWVGE